jgi:hypothetical protein
VNDPPDVRSFETVSHPERHHENLLYAHPLPDDPLFQRLAFEQLHGDEMPAFVLVDVVDGADVRVIQRRGRLGLPFEALQTLAVVG